MTAVLEKKMEEYASLGNELMDQGEYQKAREIFEQQLALIEEPKENQFAATWTYASIGDSYFQENNFCEAKKAYFSAMKCRNGHNNPYLCLMFGICSYEEDQTSKEAIEYMKFAYHFLGSSSFVEGCEKYASLVMDENLELREFSFDENGILMDTDPVFQLLSQWMTEEKYEMILATIEQVGELHRSNTLWFHKIETLHAMKRFQDAKHELDVMHNHCKTPADRARWCYLLGYYFDHTDCEFKAIECYEMGKHVDPSHTLDVKYDFVSCIDASSKVIETRLEALKNETHLIFEDIRKRCMEEEKRSLQFDEFVMNLGFVHSSYHIPGMDHSIGFSILATKFDAKDQETAQGFFRQQGITDYESLQLMLGSQSVEKSFQDFKDHYEEYQKSSPAHATYLKASSMFEASLKDEIPSGHFLAWDINEKIGKARALYASDLISSDELDEIAKDCYNIAIASFHSWEEYARSLVLGGAYYMFSHGNFNLLNAGRYINQFSAMIKANYPGLEW